MNSNVMLCIINNINENMIALREAQSGPRHRAIHNTSVRNVPDRMYTELLGKQSGAITCSVISNVTNVTPRTTSIHPKTASSSNKIILAAGKRTTDSDCYKYRVPD